MPLTVSPRAGCDVAVKTTGKRVAIVTGGAAAVAMFAAALSMRGWAVERFEVEIDVGICGGPLAGSGFKATVIKTEAGWEVSPGSIRDRINS